MLYTKLKHRTKEIKELTDLGLISTTWLRDLRIFESFHALPEKLCVYCKYEIVAEEEGLSSDRVKSIVQKLKK